MYSLRRQKIALAIIWPREAQHAITKQICSEEAGSQSAISVLILYDQRARKARYRQKHKIVDGKYKIRNPGKYKIKENATLRKMHNQGKCKIKGNAKSRKMQNQGKYIIGLPT